jgi:hypothetical protein
MIYRAIFKQNTSKIGKNTEGGNTTIPRQKAKLDFDKKIHNYVLKKKKKKKKKKKRLHRTPYLRQPAAKSLHTKAQRRRVCVSTTVL